VLARAPADAPLELQVAAYEAIGGLDYWVADFEAAARHYEQQLAAARAMGDPARIGQALYNLGFPLTFGGIDRERAWAVAREAETTFRSIGDRPGMARTLWLLGNLAYDQGDLANAERYSIEAVPMLREFGDPFMLGWAIYTVGLLRLLGRRLDEGHDRLLEALDRFEAAGDVTGITLVLDGLAFYERESGALYRAARISGAVEQLEATTGTALNSQNRRSLGFDPLPLKEDPATAEAWRSGSRTNIDEILRFVRQREATPASTA
jgi:tetratricopeptide (TPR) repeat protein